MSDRRLLILLLMLFVMGLLMGFGISEYLNIQDTLHRVRS